MGGLILIVSYPKSGNTWIRALLTSVLTQGSPVSLDQIRARHCADRGLYDALLDMEGSDLTSRETAHLRPRIYETAMRYVEGDVMLKVHDAWLPTLPNSELPFPRHIVRKVIYIVRDPRDVAVSFANYIGKPIDYVIHQMNEPRYSLANRSDGLRMQIMQRLSTWSAHVESWLWASQLATHLVRFEDLLFLPADTLRSLLTFLGFLINEDVINRAVDATRFDVLRSQEADAGFIERPRSASRFFARGQAGYWKTILTDAQSGRIANDHGSVMKALGYS